MKINLQIRIMGSDADLNFGKEVRNSQNKLTN